MSALPPPPDPRPTLPRHPAPPAAPPGRPDGGSPRWRGLPLAARLAERDARRSRVGTAVGVVAGAAAALVLAGTDRPRVLSSLAAVTLASVAAALAGGTHPAQRHDAAVLEAQGLRRLPLRVAAALAGFVPVTLGAWATLVGVAAVGRSPVAEAAALALVLPVAGATLACGARLAAPAQQTGQDRLARSLGRAGAGGILLVLGVGLPTGSASGSDVDLTLPLATLLALAGLVVLSPLAIGLAARALARAGRATVALAGSEVAAQRRSLGLPVAVTAGVALVLVVQSVLGTGLGQREADRRQALAELGPATAGRSERQVVLSRTFSSMAQAFEAELDGGPAPDEPAVDEPAELLAAATTAAPAARVVPVDDLPLRARSADARYGRIDRPRGLVLDPNLAADGGGVAVATPELLAALDLDPALAEGPEAVVLDRRVLRADGTVDLVAQDTSDTSEPDARAPATPVPARLAEGSVAVALPAVLLPRSIDHGGSAPSRSLVVVLRFPDRPDDAQLLALEAATGAEAVRGDTVVDLARRNRTDRIESVDLRTDDDVADLAAALAPVALTALVVAQLALALAQRRQDEVLDVLGARPRTRALVAAARGAIIGVVGTALGAAVGLAGTAAGLAQYAERGRLTGPDPLAAIPWSVPPAAVLGLVVLPLLSAAAGAAIALVRRPSDPITRAERLAW